MKISQQQILVSAGDAITAKLVQEAGFQGIWVSGFEVSARMGLPDNGSITLTEMLDVCRPIVRAVKIPVFVDVDTGYGNFERTVREFEDIGVAGICVEDNLPNKCNSLWGGKFNLMSMREFGEKITVPHKFKIIARTEALIRGFGSFEATIRLKHYIRCGADIVLPHVRDKNDIIKPCFDVPSAIVPTKFPNFTNKFLNRLGYEYIIWANHTERIKIKAIREGLRVLKQDDCAKNIENKLSATLEDLRSLCPI